jgi:hypothetical protein
MHPTIIIIRHCRPPQTVKRVVGKFEARLDGRQIDLAPAVARRRQGAGAEGLDLAPLIAMRQRKKTISERTGAQARRSAHAPTQAKRPRHA